MGAEGKNYNYHLPEYIYFIDTLVYILMWSVGCARLLDHHSITALNINTNTTTN